MKSLTMLGILVIILTGCKALSSPQSTQQKRERLLAAYDAARQKHNPEKIKQAVKDLLVGKWEYVGLEVEEKGITIRKAEPIPQQSSSTTDEVTADITIERTEAPESPNPEKDEQALDEETTRLPEIEVTDEKSEQQILAAKVALVASTRQNLTLEFFEDRSSYYYNSSNAGKNATGQCYITAKQYGDDSLPFISFNRRTGPDMVEFLFGSEPVKLRGAKERARKIAMRRNVTPVQGASRNRRLTSPPVRPVRYQERDLFMPAITVTEDTLSLVLYGEVALSPEGWVRAGGLRCTFKRVE